MTPEETLALHNIAKAAGTCAYFLAWIHLVLFFIAIQIAGKK